MRILTLLNKCSRYKSFVFEKASFFEAEKSLEVSVKPRKNSKPLCSVCLRPGPVYDTERHLRMFEAPPLIFGSNTLSVLFAYCMRRVSCVFCKGVKMEAVPWAEGKRRLTRCHMIFLASWCRSLSWKETAERFGTSWHKVFQSVQWVVEWGLKHRSLEDVTSIGVDEIFWKKGYKCLTLVYQINKENVRLLWAGQDRTEESFHRFFDMLGDRAKDVKYICSDMWKPYLKVIKERAGHAVHILDRFHIAARLNKALDEIRAGEHRKMKADGYDPLLTKARWLLLKRRERLTGRQKMRLRDLVQYNLRSVRAYLLKEDFHQLWGYVSFVWAGKFIDHWTRRVMRSRLEPMKREARSIRRHKDLILNYFRAKKQFSSGVVEGLNGKVKLVTRKSFGFKSWKAMEIALYHNLGNLPDPPKVTHRFF